LKRNQKTQQPCRTIPRGVICVAVGEEIFFREAVFSANSVRKSNPNLPITIFTDKIRRCSPWIQCSILEELELSPFTVKIACAIHTPFKRTLFLDTDTVICGDLSPLFDMLDSHDFLIAYDCNVDWYGTWQLLDLVHPTDCNTGVFAFKDSGAAQELLKFWLGRLMTVPQSTLRHGSVNDQSEFNELKNNGNTFKEIGLKCCYIDNSVWNVRPWMKEHLVACGKLSKSIIHHYRNYPGQPHPNGGAINVLRRHGRHLLSILGRRIGRL